MENSKKIRFVKKILILLAVIGLIGLSWLTGHILRHTLPELWHPPIRMPGEKIGDFQEYTPINLGGIQIKNWEPFVWDKYISGTN